MTLLIAIPDTHPAERDYSLGVILGEFFGLPWRRVRSPDAAVHLHLSDAPREIRLSDQCLAQPEEAWLRPDSLPALPLATWDTRDLAPDLPLVDPQIPVIFGETRPATRWNDKTLTLPVDIFGSAFFMLSRYEEAVTTIRDNHDRFPATASIAYQAGFLDRPIIDEYVEILWAAIQRVWPGLERKPRTARTLSCDVDQPNRLSSGLPHLSAFPELRPLRGDLAPDHGRGGYSAGGTGRTTTLSALGNTDHCPIVGGKRPDLRQYAFLRRPPWLSLWHGP